ncbi:kinase/pyrophosphorylase [Bartonella sp. B12(2025)]
MFISIYLANRGIKIVNVSLIPNADLPKALLEEKNAFVIGLIASVERISHVRKI